MKISKKLNLIFNYIFSILLALYEPIPIKIFDSISSSFPLGTRKNKRAILT